VPRRGSSARPGGVDRSVRSDGSLRRAGGDKSALIVAYCGSEHCGAYKKGAKAAAELGYTNVKHFAPGIKGWKATGEPTEAAK